MTKIQNQSQPDNSLERTNYIDKQNQPTVLFWLRKQKINKSNEAPIYCRITLKGLRNNFTTGICVPVSCFNNGEIKSITPVLKQKQLVLDKIKINMERAILACRIRYDNPSIELIKKAYLYGFKHAFSLCDVLAEFMEKREKLIDIDIAFNTFNRNVNCSNLIKEFIKKKLKRTDIALEEIRESFANNLYFYLRTEKKHATTHIKKTFDLLKMVINYAVLHDYVDKNYLSRFCIKNDSKKEIKHLNSEQLFVLRNTTFRELSFDYVRDCFLFQCYTGMAYTDLSTFSLDNIQVDDNGNKWIVINRNKSGSKCTIPVLKEAELLILKYKDLNHRSNPNVSRVSLFPVFSNQVMNRILKKIAIVCKIPKDIMCTHTARKSFAMMALNKGNVSIETVSKILGHSKIDMTQRYYGYVNQTKILSEIKNFEFISNN